MCGHPWRLKTALFLILLVLVDFYGPSSWINSLVAISEHPDEPFEELIYEEMEKEKYFRMVDGDGRTIVITGRRLRIGDRYLDVNNRLYEVIEVEDYLARARLIEKVKHDFSLGSSHYKVKTLPVQAGTSRRIAFYHSHNAESYVPSDGTDSIYGKGGIHDVGAAFRDVLEDKGINALYSERLHLPHDRGAYRRSRVTVQELLSQRPDAIFDIHRDAAPWEAYALELEGEVVTQIQIVVGLNNPGFATNRKFAFDLKGHGDRIHPELIRGVFLIWGGYNQDLSPTNLLLEVGAHTNTKESAIKGITLFADIVGYYFYGPDYVDGETGEGVTEGQVDEETLPPALYRDAGGISSAISGTVIGLLLTSLGAALGFYLLNNPSALENMANWRENFPEKLLSAVHKLRGYIKVLPGEVNSVWHEAPRNLRQGWHDLRLGAHNLPVLVKGKLTGGKNHFTALYKAAGFWAVHTPRKLRSSWARLIEEGKELPGFLSRRFDNAIRRSSNHITRLRLKTASIRLSLYKNLTRSWSLMRVENSIMVHIVKDNFIKLVLFIREKFSMFRNRLGP